MQQLKISWNKQSLRNRLIAWFLLIALVPVGWITIISYEVCKKILFDQANRHLQALISRQEQMISFYHEEKKLDARVFIKNRAALNALAELKEVILQYGENSPEHDKVKEKFYSMLTFHMKALDYRNLLLVTKTGDVVFSASPLPELGNNLLTSSSYISLAKIFERTRDSLEMETTSIALKLKEYSLNTFISIPLIDTQNQLVGVAIVELNAPAIYRFLSNLNELRVLAQLLLLINIDQHFFIIEPSSSQKEEDILHPVNSESPFGEYIQKIFNHSEPVSAHLDYRGHKAMMVGKRFLNSSNWALLTKINEDELLAPIFRLQYLFWILVPATAVIVTLAASHVARKIASPILTLTEKTKILAGGDLSQRIEVNTQDEIGRLGQSFNDMAAQLNHIISHLDDLVAKRTKEYEIQNVKLEQTIKELRQTRDRLITQEKLASLGALTAGIAHEIKNPLNFINNFAELSLQLVEELEGHLNAIKPSLQEKDIQELMELINTFKLNISKIYEHGKRADSIVYNMLQHSRGMPGERRTINIHKLLDEYIALVYHGMRAQDSTFNVTIEKHYDPSLPSIGVVPQEISRVFLNLLNNAYYSINQKRKQHSDPTYQPKVIISTEFHQNFAIIKIWDNGLGISPDILPKLFTPFFTTKPTGEGTGLGLSLSYNIVVQGHGGTLNVNSQEGEFAEFVITLPVHK